ncbi:MAG: hypothetical protein AAFQ62_09280 [Pseudomonadota bacterium]
MQLKIVAGFLVVGLVSGLSYSYLQSDQDLSSERTEAESAVEPIQPVDSVVSSSVASDLPPIDVPPNTVLDNSRQQRVAPSERDISVYGDEGGSAGDQSFFAETLSTRVINARSPYETIDIMRTQPVDRTWAERTQEEISENTSALLQESGASLSILECYSENCMFSYISPESASAGPGTFIEIAQAVTALDAKVDVIADENSPYQWFLLIRFER